MASSLSFGVHPRFPALSRQVPAHGFRVRWWRSRTLVPSDSTTLWVSTLTRALPSRALTIRRSRLEDARGKLEPHASSSATDNEEPYVHVDLNRRVLQPGEHIDRVGKAIFDLMTHQGMRR